MASSAATASATTGNGTTTDAHQGSLVSPSSMVVKMRFNVGNKYVLVTIPFDKGEDVGESIKRFCVDEDIPCYLEPSILSALTVLCDEEAKGKAKTFDKTTKRLPTLQSFVLMLWTLLLRLILVLLRFW